MSISRQRSATPYLYQGSRSAETEVVTCIPDSGLMLSLGRGGLSDEEDSVLLGTALVAGCPEVEDHEGNEKREGHAQVAAVDVRLTGEDQRVGNPTGRGQAADETGRNARAVREE